MNWIKKIWHGVCRMVLFVAMLFGIAGLPKPTMAQCTPGDPDPSNVLRVDAASEASTPDGFSWACAFSDLQEAIEHLDGDFDTIWIAQGTYTPSIEVDLNPFGGSDARRRAYGIPPGITVLGGFPTGGGDGTVSARNPAMYVTTLSGDLDNNDNDPEAPNPLADNAFHVVIIVDLVGGSLGSTVVDGFTITAGNANGIDYNSGGGGVHVFDQSKSQSAPTFRQCLFTNNYASATGGGILLRKAGAFLRQCEFRNNTTGGSGVDEYDGGGAVAANGPLNVIDSKFVMNSTDENSGGAIRNVSNQSTKLVDCEFYGNMAAFGGAVSTSAGIAANCLFAGNQALNGSGGALVGGEAHGCTFADNYASNLGGALRT